MKENCVAIFVAAILGVVWWFPQFPTTDGPSHVYNAEIIRQHILGRGPQLRTFQVSLLPLPNWTGHALLAAFLTVLSPATAERCLVSLYFVAWAAALRLYLRATGAWTPATGLFGTLLAINLPFMMGFYNFCFGIVGYVAVMGLWCKGFPRCWRQAAIFASVLVLTYFCHPLPFVASCLAIVWLWVTTPVQPPKRDWYRTALAGAPALALFVWFSFSSLGRGNPTAISRQLPPTYGGKLNWQALQCLWYGAGMQHAVALAALALWVALFVSAAWSRSAPRLPTSIRHWTAIAALAGAPIVIGLLVPEKYDELFLAPRLVVLGLITGVGAFPSCESAWLRRLSGGVVALLAAASVVTLLDYDRRSNDERTAFAIAQARIGDSQSMLPVVNWRPTFRVDTMSHAEGYLAVTENQIDFGNYEADLDYFAVRFRSDVERPSKLSGQGLEAADIVETARKVDALLVWGWSPPALARSAAFTKTFESGRAQLYLSSLRAAPSDSSSGLSGSFGSFQLATLSSDPENSSR